jgi:hypothetical protein
MTAPRSVLARIRIAQPSARPPCLVCGRHGLISPISLPNAPRGMGPACSSSCLETLRHRLKRKESA